MRQQHGRLQCESVAATTLSEGRLFVQTPRRLSWLLFFG